MSPPPPRIQAPSGGADGGSPSQCELHLRPPLWLIKLVQTKNLSTEACVTEKFRGRDLPAGLVRP